MKQKTVKALCVLLSVVIIFCSVWYFNNFTVRISNVSIYSDKVSNEIKITVISDLHGAEFGKNNSVLIEKIKSTKPDMIFVLGDMYSRYQKKDISIAVNLITILSKTCKVFLVTGEHDTDDNYKEQLSRIDNTFYLHYNYKNININGNNLCIYGIDNVYFSNTFNLNKAFKKPDKNKLNILLSHIPEFELYSNFDVDMIFSGDTHGGLIRLPFLGGLYYKGYLIPKITYSGNITDKGLYHFGNQNIFVTSGLGYYPIPLRFNNRPEICAITIKKENNQ